MHYAARRITGVPWGEYWRWAMKRTHTKPVRRVLSIGCGGGELERRMIGQGWARAITAIDVSPGAVDAATAAAEVDGVLHRIDYRVADVNAIELEPAAYDVVIAQQSLHHVGALEHVADQIALALRPGGVLVINEYVGPTRFQLPPQQLDAINATLAAIPRARRVRASDGTIKDHQHQFDLAWFDANDPSEAIRSADIMPVLRDRFIVTDVRPYGGGLLQFLLDDIVGNFTGVAGYRELGRLARRERQLESQGVLASDFLVAVARLR